MQVDIPNTPDSVADARQQIAQALAEWGLTGSPSEGALVDDVLLVATELLSNAVKFSGGGVALALSWNRSVLRVSVTDNSPSPAAPRPAGLDARGGRGLAIVAALAKRWGQTAYVDGCKEVWAEVGLARPSGAGVSRSTATAAILGG